MLPAAPAQTRSRLSSWAKVALAAAVAGVGLCVLLILTAAVLAAAVVGALVAAVAFAARQLVDPSAGDGPLEARRTADGWVVEADGGRA